MQGSCGDASPAGSGDSSPPLPGATAREHWVVPTVNDVPEALGIEKVAQTCHLVLQLPDELVVGVLVDDSIAADLLGTVGVPREGQSPEQCSGGANPQLLGKREGHRAPPASNRLEDPSAGTILWPLV